MEPDLLTQIELQYAVTRSEARRILIDLIDHHKRMSRSITRSGNNHRFTAPVSTTSRNPWERMNRKNTPKGHNPHRKSRIHQSDGSVQLSASDLERIQKMRPHDPKPLYRFHKDSGDVPWGHFEIVYNGTQLFFRKTEFIVTCLDHGMTRREILDFLSNHYERKPFENDTEFLQRVRLSVHATGCNFRPGVGKATA